MPATTAQVAPAQEAGRPQPQTTVEPPGGPFIRHSQLGRRVQYVVTGQAFGTIITQPLVAVPGYIRGFRVRVAASGGTGTTTVAAAADAPYNTASLVTLKDAFGTPLIVGPGYEVFFLIPMYSGQYGLLTAADISKMPSFSAVATGASSSGSYTFSTYLPLEVVKGIGCISGANASLLPTLQFNLNALSTVLTTSPNTTAPTLEFDVNADFYWLPEGVNVEPPGLGTTCQWVLQQGNPTVASATTTTVTLPRLGGYLSTIILILRDSTGARITSDFTVTASSAAEVVTGWPARLRLTVDGVPLIDTRFGELADDIYNQYGGITRPTGTIAFTRRLSMSQISLGLFESGETLLSTNPGTLVQVEGAPWGTISSSPGTLNALAGQIVPAGSLIQGLPEI